MAKGKRRVSKIYQSLGATVVARGLRAVTLMPKHQVLLEESEDEEEPAQNSGVGREEDDDTAALGRSV